VKLKFFNYKQLVKLFFITLARGGKPSEHINYAIIDAIKFNIDFFYGINNKKVVISVS